MNKIPRIQQVMVKWAFGQYNKGMFRNEPMPPAVSDLELGGLPTTLTKVTSIMNGKEGEIEFIFAVPTNGNKFFVEEVLRTRMHSVVDGRILPNIRVGSVVTSKGSYFSFTFKFPPQPGETFTTTATHCFIETLKRFLHPANLVNLPIPQVTSETIWRIGKEKVPFGVAVALDTYMNGAFKRIRRVFEAKGEVVAGELCRRLLIALRSKECGSAVFSEAEGAEVLIGGSMFGWISLSLLVDGYCRYPVKIGSSDFFPEHAKEIAQIIKNYKLKTCVIFPGEYLDFSKGKRFPCEELEQKPFESFIQALRVEGIEIEK